MANWAAVNVVFDEVVKVVDTVFEDVVEALAFDASIVSESDEELDDEHAVAADAVAADAVAADAVAADAASDGRGSSGTKATTPSRKRVMETSTSFVNFISCRITDVGTWGKKKKDLSASYTYKKG